MWFFSKKRQKAGKENDRLAAMVAVRILSWQRKTADRLNCRVRHYERAGQLRWLWLFCFIAASAIICSALITGRNNALPPIRPPVSFGHIGQSSNGPPRMKPLIPTDSLTPKIQKHGNDQ